MITTRRLAACTLSLLLAVALAVPGAAAPPQAAADSQDRRSGGLESTRSLVERTLRQMTVKEKIGQLFWTRAYGASARDKAYAEQNQADYGVDTAAQVVRKYRLGGVLYFAWAGNTSHPDQMVELSNGLQERATRSRSRVPLSLSIDQEGGIVQRLLEPGTVFPGNMPLGATRSRQLTRAQYRALGEELRAVGVNTNFAPVTDVNTNPANPVIGVRSFGEDPDLVGRLGTVATRALQTQNVGATLKHFPGHGDTEVDSHFGLPIVTYDRRTLEDIHLAPFRRAIARAEPDAIMTAHIIVEAIDAENPATLSRPVLTGLLRKDMGYEGLIVTDSLDMAGAREEYGDDQIPVLAVRAGADVLLNPPDMDAAWNGMLDAVRSGEISRQRLDRSVRRILRWKVDRGLFRDPYADPRAVEDHVGTPRHLAIAEDIATSAATVVANDEDLLPLAGDGNAAVVGPSLGEPAVVAEEVTARGMAAETVATATNPTAAEIGAAAAAAQGKDLAVVTTYNARTYAGQRDLVAAVIETGTPTLVVATRDPYDIAHLPGVETFMATYGNRPVSLRGAMAVAFGDAQPVGTLPVTIPTADGGGVLYPYGHGLGYGG